MKSNSISAAILVGLLWIGFASADEPSPRPTKDRVDLYGDPLPPGAVARFGTVQMRMTGDCDVTVLSDSKTLAIVAPDRIVRYWDLTTGKVLRAKTIGDGTKRAKDVKFSSDGKFLAIRIEGEWTTWDLETNKPVGQYAEPTLNSRVLRVFREGQLFAFLQGNELVTLWDRAAGTQRVLRIPGEIDAIRRYSHANISADCRWLACFGKNGEPFSVIDLASGKEVHRHPRCVTSSAFTADSKQLVVCDNESNASYQPGPEVVKSAIRFFDLENGKEVKQFPVGDCEYSSLALSPDGRRLVCWSHLNNPVETGLYENRTCDWQKSIVMDTATGSVIHQFPAFMRGSAWARWTPDGRVLIASDDYRVQVWDAAAWKERFPQPDGLGLSGTLAISPSGRYLASGGGWWGHPVYLWEAASGKLIREFPRKARFGRYLACLSFSADGRSLLASQFNNYHQSWDVETGRQLLEIQLDNGAGAFKPSVEAAHISGDGKRVTVLESEIVGKWSKTLVQWDTVAKKIVAKQKWDWGPTYHPVWLDDGREVVLCLPDGLQRIRVADGQSVWRAPGVYDWILAGTPGGELVAASKYLGPYNKRTVLGIWETASGKEVAAVDLRQSNDFGDHFALASDLLHLVTTDRDSLKVWDIATGKVCLEHALPDVVQPQFPYGHLWELVLSPDGRRAFTSFSNDTALAWDLTPSGRTTSPTAKPSDKELQKWWADLASNDGPTGYAAFWRLREADPLAVVALFRKQLSPVGPPDPKTLAKLITDLDNANFNTREAATRELGQLGPVVHEALRGFVAGNPSAEARRRANNLLQRTQSPPSGDTLRALRAIQVLFQINRPEAREHLTALSRGAPEHPVTEAAKAALERGDRH